MVGGTRASIWRPGLALLTAGALVLAGCGGSDLEPPSPPADETPASLPKLPDGWSQRIDTTSGYAMGVPPGWRPVARGGRTLFRSPDEIAVVSISADRTDEALAIPVDQFATRAIAALGGFEQPLEPSEPRPFRGTPLDAVRVDAGGRVADTGVMQRVTLVVLRREGVVNYALVLAVNAGQPNSDFERDLALRMVETLRTYPIGAPVPEA